MLVAGARPNFIKLAPLYFDLKKYPSQFDPIIVHTGQHYDSAMSKIFFSEFGLPEPDYFLGVGSGSHAHQTGNVMIKIEEIMISEQPDLVVVFGDVNSTMAAALSACKLGIRIAHVEAGLRSFDMTMPEEINRIVTDILADLLLTSCDDANLNLIKKGVDLEKIFLVGNIMIDTLKHFLPMADKSDILQQLDISEKDYLLVTLHRPANVDNRDSINNVVDIIMSAAEKKKIVFPIHPRTRKNLEEIADCQALFNNLNIILTEPLGYLDFIKLEKEALLVMTDSGGIQEETTYLGVPCLTLRANTERPVTITDGTNRLVGLDQEKITSQLDYYLSGGIPSNKKPYLWDGQTAERIVKVLQEYFKNNQKHNIDEKLIHNQKRIIEALK